MAWQDATHQIDEAVQVGVNAAHDFSILGMFMAADLVVKSVMIALLLASIWGWQIIIATWKRVKSAESSADRFEDTFWSGNSLDDLYNSLRNAPDHPMAAVFVTAMREWKRSIAGGRSSDKSMMHDRIVKVMRVTTQREMHKMEGQVGFLATIGSAAPFVGLFGTVWGIMNAFADIAMASDTSLATVAPGISEALLATALGLVAAIPAVMAYNKLAGDLGRYASRVEGFSEEFAAIVSRQLDERSH